jgi:glycosyltransferase involved in cell wall biosynthesis
MILNLQAIKSFTFKKVHLPKVTVLDGESESMNKLNLEEISVSVVVPTKNSERTILECLSSLFNQSIKPLEVIVVDGRSTDDTTRLALSYPVKIIVEEEPTSLPNARNLGTENAKGEFIFIVDSDIIADRDCIKNAAKWFRNPEMMAVIPAEHNIPRSHLENIQTKWLMGTSSSLRNGIGITAFAEFFRRTVFERLKFDRTLGIWEDHDFQQRLKNTFGASGRIVFSLDSKVYVKHPQNLKELKVQYTWYGRTVKSFLSKGLSMRTILNLFSLLSPMLLLFLSVLSIFFMMVAYISILILALLATRSIVACFRSKSPYFFEFFAFEFIRSLFFSLGIIQGFFSKKRGK